MKEADRASGHAGGQAQVCVKVEAVRRATRANRIKTRGIGLGRGDSQYDKLPAPFIMLWASAVYRLEMS